MFKLKNSQQRCTIKHFSSEFPLSPCSHRIVKITKKAVFSIGLGDISNISDNIAIIMTMMSNFKISWISNISNSSILSQKNSPNVQYYIPLSSLLPRKRREVFFISAIARYQDFKSPNQSFPVTRIHSLPGVLFILSNLATMRTCSLRKRRRRWSENTDKQGLRPNVHTIHPKFYAILVIFNTI